MEPRKKAVTRHLDYYSRKFYYKRVKPTLDQRMQAAALLPNPPHIVKLRPKVTAECWDAETQSFKDEVLAAIAKEKEASDEGYKMAVSGDEPNTPKEYSV